MITRLGAGTAATAAAALAVVLGLAAARPAAAGTAKPVAPDAAAALVSATPTAASGSTVRIVTAAEALASASTPGASVWVEPGLSLAQAVGTAATPTAASYSTATTASTTLTYCWANAAWREWGTWPYQQRLTDTTYWCAAYGIRITFHSSTTTASGTLCGVSWRASQLVGGGTGYSWFTIRSSAGWSCPTAIPWISLHPSHYQDVERNSWGSTWTVGSG